MSGDFLLSCIWLGHCDCNVTNKRRALNGPGCLRWRHSFPWQRISLLLVMFMFFLLWASLWLLCEESCGNPPQASTILEFFSNLNDSVILWSVLQDLNKKWHPGSEGLLQCCRNSSFQGRGRRSGRSRSPSKNSKFSLKRKYQNPYRQVLNSCKIYILRGAEVGSVPGFYPHFVPLLLLPNIKREKLK